MVAADRIVVMRDGRVVGETSPKLTDQVGLARMMVGRDVVFRIDKAPAKPTDPVLEVTDLVVVDERKLDALKEVSLTVRAGEIVGIAGVDGNGQRELVEAIVGLRKPRSGKISLRGKDITHAAPRETIQAGVSHVPEDRHRRGLVLEFDLAENLVLGDHASAPYATAGIMHSRVIDDTARKRIADYDVRTPSVRVLAENLSGGNQQKLVLARELGRDPDLLIAAQPTRGLDVGAIEFVHRRILAERDSGKAILLVSMELEEVMTLSDRILVMYEGRIAAEFVAGEADEERLGYFMTGGKREAARESVPVSTGDEGGRL
jgi:simple sugar transport system ATP-binding protein